MFKLKIFFSPIIILFSILITSLGHAQEYNWQKFNKDLTLTRGTFFTTEQFSQWLPKNDFCNLVKTEWGWETCSGIEAFMVFPSPMVDTLIISEPTSVGYVKFDDWYSSDKDKSISEIEKELKKSLKRQGETIGSDIQFLGWHTYPTLNQEKKFLYYATKVMWDGEINLNVKASIFDRRGYVEFMIVPIETTVSSPAIEQMIIDTLTKYEPLSNESYASFTAGDKISELGSIGVLASLAGVKWGKVAVAGLTAILLAFAKKAWIILLIPFLFIGRLFRKKSDE